MDKLSTAQEIRDQTLKEAQEVSTALIAAEQRIGELLLAIPKQTGMRTDLLTSETRITEVKTKTETIKDMGYSPDEAKDYQRMAKNPEVVQQVIQTALANGDIVTKTAVMKEIKALHDEIRDRDKRIQEMVDAPTVEIRTPNDYYDLKKKAKEADAWRRDYNDLQDRRTKELARTRELERELAELKSATAQGLDTENLSQNVYFFCTTANNFIGNVGGLVWLTERIGDMPEKERDLFIKAATSFRDWALAFTANLEKGMRNGSDNGTDGRRALPSGDDHEEN